MPTVDCYTPNAFFISFQPDFFFFMSPRVASEAGSGVACEIGCWPPEALLAA